MTSPKPLLLSSSSSLLSLQTDPNAINRPRRIKPTRSTSSSVSSAFSTADSSGSAAVLAAGGTPGPIQHLVTPPASYSTSPNSPLSSAHSGGSHVPRSSQVTYEARLTPPATPPPHPHTQLCRSASFQPAHRHSGAFDAALCSLCSLTASPNVCISPTSNQTTPTSSHHPAYHAPSLSTAAVNLHLAGWTHICTRKDVRVYSKQPFEPHPSHVPSALSPSEIAISVPYFRGEGWLAGKWNHADLAATLSSLQARAAYDAKLDGSRSATIQILDPDGVGDRLVRVWTRDRFPIGSREQCVVSGFRRGGAGQRAFWLSTSVVDGLISEPADALTRSWCFLNGVGMTHRSTRPAFQEDLPTSPELTMPSVSPSKGAVASRTSPVDLPSIVKRMSLVKPLVPHPSRRRMTLIDKEPPPRPASTRPSTRRATMNFVTLPNSHAQRPINVISPIKLSPSSAANRHVSGMINKDAAIGVDHEDDRLRGEGTQLSFVCRVHHRGKVPTSFVQQVLTVEVPELVASFIGHLERYGFAPHLSREGSIRGIKILGEEYDPILGYYKLQYVIRQSGQCATAGSGDVRPVEVRFSTLGFGCDPEVVVRRAQKWIIKTDHDDHKSDQDSGSRSEKIGGGRTVVIERSLDGPVEVIISRTSQKVENRTSPSKLLPLPPPLCRTSVSS